MSRYEVRVGDCREVMQTMDADSVDAIVSDPPYGLSFLGKGWDHGVPGVEFWVEALRVAKPGAHLLAFGGTRTFHRLACAIEDAGWDIRDCVMWVYGSGFPKSHNLGGAWDGWGTALKPAWEPVIVARAPLSGTVADNMLRHGTGAMNIDGCRVEAERRPAFEYFETGSKRGYDCGIKGGAMVGTKTQGRWPANLIHDGSDEVARLFPSNAGGGTATRGASSRIYGGGKGFTAATGDEVGYGDSGSAARFFYCAKASKADRDHGCGGLEAKRTAKLQGSDNDRENLDPVSERFRTQPSRNHHPTVKPTALMRYLCRLVTPPGGIVLDPFMGSGSTGKGALLEGFRFIGIELSEEYATIAKARLAHAVDGKLDL